MDAVLKRKEQILNGPALRTIIMLAIPLMLGNLIQTMYNITDAFWVGKIGSVEFAAVSYVWPITFMFLAFSIGMTIAATSLIGQSIGSGQQDRATVIATQFFTLSVVGGIVFAVAGYLLTPTIIGLMGAEGMLYRHSVDYLRIIFLETPVLFLFHVYKSMKEGAGDTKTPTIYLGISVGLNIVLDPILILVLGWGVKGAAIATVASRLLVVGFMIIKMFDKKEMVHVELHALRPDMPVLKNLLNVGMPASAGYIMTALGFTIMNSFVVSYGDQTVAAVSLGDRITNLVMMPIFGLGAALASFISQNIGAEQYDRARRSVYATIVFGFAMLATGGVFIHLLKIPLIHIFINEPEVVSLSSGYLSILVFTFPLMAVIQSVVGAFQGSGHTKYVLFMTMSRLWLLRIPMVFILMNFTDLGYRAIWYAMLASNAVISVIGIGLIAQGKWLKQTLSTASTEEQS